MMQTARMRELEKKRLQVAERDRELRKAMSWIRIAEFKARELSKDQSTKVGAIILGQDWEVVSTGYNGMPRGVDDNVAERHERPEKYSWFAHAEENAIAQAARRGHATLGCKMVVTGLLPCETCARMIINSGITQVYSLKPEDPELEKRWAASNQRALTMFKEANVGVITLGHDGSRRFHSTHIPNRSDT